MKYLLSIVIPTKNRFDYLKECISALIKINSNKMEIVIQDNSDNMQVKEYIETLNWPHLKYFHETRKLSQTGNSELAVGNSNGKYVCYIGDDDAITPQLINVVELMDKYSIDASTFSASKYNWPDVIDNNPSINALRINKTALSVNKLDPIEILNRYLSDGMQEIKLLPRVYHGVLSRTVLDEIKLKTGSYFPGPSPDMANATAASFIVKNYYRIDLPLIIDGKSYKSAGGMGLRGAHTGKLSEAAQLSPNVERDWDQRIPKLWLGRTIWPESCIKALEAMNEKKYINTMNWHAIYARILLRNSEYSKEVKVHLRTPYDYLKVGIILLERMIKYSFAVVESKIRKIFKFEYVCNERISIDQAIETTQQILLKNNYLKIVEEAFSNNK